MTTTGAEQVAPAFSYETLDDLSDQTAAVVLAVWAMRPDMPEAEWIEYVVQVLVAVILQGEAWGLAYGELDAGSPVDSTALVPESETGYRPAPEDFDPEPTDRDLRPADALEDRIDVEVLRLRIERAIRTLARSTPRPTSVEEAPPPLDRVERIARDEPIQAAQHGYQAALREHATEEIVGYRRGINPDACELCFWLWKEGYVYPLHQEMHRHIGCRCWPVPTTDKVGRHSLSKDDQRLLEDLYDKYVR